MKPAWGWPLSLNRSDVEVSIAGPREALNYLQNDWPFERKGYLFRIAFQILTDAVKTGEVGNSAYLAFRAAAVESALIPIPARRRRKSTDEPQ